MVMINRDKLILDNIKLINNVIRKYYKECTVDEEDLKLFSEKSHSLQLMG